MSLVARLADGFPSPLILVFDQFEELLRNADSSVVADAIDLIGDIFEQQPDVRALLSLRAEYMKEIYSLENVLGGLRAKVVELRPLSPGVAADAAVQGAKAGPNVQFEFKDGVEGEVVRLSQSSTSKSDADGFGPGGLDLLTFQCLLYELATAALAGAGDARPVVIDNATLASLQKDYPSSPAFAKGAIRRWIDRALARPSRSLVDSWSTSPLQQVEGILDGMVYRAARLIAPYLSTGGFKNPLHEGKLYSNAFEDDLTKLRRPISAGMRSGYAFPTGPWGKSNAARDVHEAAYYEMLERLHEANVLKRYHGHRCELVHDKLGEPYAEWAQARRSYSLSEATTSLVAWLGKDVDAAGLDPDSRLRHMVWRGAWVFHPGEHPELALFDGTVFDECDLRGAIFDRCVFRGATFQGGMLDGVVFRGCQFLPGRDGRPSTFSNVTKCQGLVFEANKQEPTETKLRIGRLEFVDCEVKLARFEDVELTGNATFVGRDHGSIVSSTVFERVRAHGDARFAFEENCRVAFCSWDNESERAVLGPREAVPDDWLHCGHVLVHPHKADSEPSPPAVESGQTESPGN
jgi:hypothetical protein